MVLELDEGVWTHLWHVVLVWVFVEVCFALYVHFVVLPYLDRPTPPIASPVFPARRLLRKVLDLMDECEPQGYNLHAFVKGWFRGADLEDIKRGNMYEFLAWAAFSARPKQLTESQLGQLEKLVVEIEARYNIQLPEGHNEKVKCCSMTLEPMPYIWRPLGFYLVLGAMQKFAELFFTLRGFQRKSVDGMGYWYKPAPSALREDVGSGRGCEDDRLPLLFFHGISSGWLAYCAFIQIFSTERAVILVDMPQIAMSFRFEPLHPKEHCAGVYKILRRHGVDHCIVGGHSFGTFTAGWFVRHYPTMCAQLVLMDPVCICLALPDVAFNFLYRDPKTPFEWLLYLFASREIGISHVLRRHFWWHNNVLWMDEVPCPVVCALGSDDQVANPRVVRHHLEMHNARTSGSAANSPASSSKSALTRHQTAPDSRPSGAGSGGGSTSTSMDLPPKPALIRRTTSGSVRTAPLQKGVHPTFIEWFPNYSHGQMLASVDSLKRIHKLMRRVEDQIFGETVKPQKLVSAQQ